MCLQPWQGAVCSWVQSRSPSTKQTVEQRCGPGISDRWGAGIPKALGHRRCLTAATCRRLGTVWSAGALGADESRDVSKERYDRLAYIHGNKSRNPAWVLAAFWKSRNNWKSAIAGFNRGGLC